MAHASKSDCGKYSWPGPLRTLLTTAPKSVAPEIRRFHTTAASAPSMESTTAQPKASLPGLPAELRSEIYRLALIDPYPIEIEFGRGEAWVDEPGLLTASREIRAESLPIFYGGDVLQAGSPLHTSWFLGCTPRYKLRLIRGLQAFNRHLSYPVCTVQKRMEEWAGFLGEDGLREEAIHIRVFADGKFIWVPVTRLAECEAGGPGEAFLHLKAAVVSG